MAMLTNTQYRSTGILELHAALVLASNRNDSSAIQLTPREHDILRCYSMGITNREAGQALGLSTYTVQTYSSDLIAKLGVKNRQKQLQWRSAGSRTKKSRGERNTKSSAFH
jgi:DNA-binding NarL/FixJ family response regulator